MRSLITILIVIANFILQSTIFRYIEILGVMPNTALIIIVSFALLGGKRTGAILGLTIGLLQDIIFCDVIGIYALIYFIIGYTIGSFNTKVFKGNPITPFVFTALSTVFFHLAYHIVMFFFSVDVQLISIIKDVALIEVIYNSILSIFIYNQISKLYMTPRMKLRQKRKGGYR